MDKTIGAPTSYIVETDLIAEKACEIFGADDKKLAKFLDIALATLTLWKKKHSTLRASIKRGKETFDTQNVEKSLLQRALGYETTEVHTESCTKEGCKGTKTKHITKHVISDIAILFWLKNRHPQRWRDIKALDISGNVGLSVSYVTNVKQIK